MAFKLGDTITAFPSPHGKAPFAMALRDTLWTQSFDCIAIAFPKSIQNDCLALIDKLPHIYGLSVRVDGEVKVWMPCDPCDSYIEAMRQGLQRHLPIVFTEGNELFEHQISVSLPDAYLVKELGAERYYELCKRMISPESIIPGLNTRTEQNFRSLSKLQTQYKNILFICDIPLLMKLELRFQKKSSKPQDFESESSQESWQVKKVQSNPGESIDTVEQWSAHPEESGHMLENSDMDSLIEVQSYPVAADHLYFALGELPFYAGELEKERQDPMRLPQDYLSLVKKLFTDTRENYTQSKREAQAISVKKLQIALTYLRNLCAIRHALTPYLMDLIEAAKGVFGSAYAAKLLTAAKYYPFYDPLWEEVIQCGIDSIQLPGEVTSLRVIHLLRDETKVWRSIRLRREPNPKEEKEYRYNWDPRGMCSHTPEDFMIEKFNQTVRNRSQEIIQSAFAKVEPMTSSLKDGVDLRETLRNVHKRAIYVREIPPEKGKVDTVVILFDTEQDERYPQCATWYAEHKHESTLTFYATDPFSHLIGPGIAECEYGGLSLLFPPRHIANIFDMFPEKAFSRRCDLLIYGALLHSREKRVAVVSQKAPDLNMKRMARELKKKLVWVPLASYSSETLYRLRRFHILNGKNVRSWANRFIDPIL